MSVAAPVEELEGPIPSFWQRAIGVLTRPRETFARMRDPDAWFWPAILLLIGYSVYFLAQGILTVQYSNSVLDETMRQQTKGRADPAATSTFGVMRQIIPASQIFAVLLPVPLYVLFTWALRSALFYGLGAAFSGSRPPWWRVVNMVGWAWLPLFIQYTVIGVLLLAVPQVRGLFLALPKAPAMAAGTMDTAAMMRQQWTVQLLFHLSPFVFWNLGLCLLGVAEVFRVPRWKAALVVLIPTLLHFALLGVQHQISMSVMNALGMDQTRTQSAPAGNTPGR